MNDRAIEEATKRGFVQGVAWAIALQAALEEHPIRCLVDFVDAGVDEDDLKRIKAAAKLGGVWDRKRANNGDS